MSKDIMKTQEMIDSIIVDCNNAVKQLVNEQYIAFCNVIAQMAQKLLALKQGIESEMNNKKATIDALEKQIEALGGQVEHYRLDEEGAGEAEE